MVSPFQYLFECSANSLFLFRENNCVYTIKFNDYVVESFENAVTPVGEKCGPGYSFNECPRLPPIPETVSSCFLLFFRVSSLTCIIFRNRLLMTRTLLTTPCQWLPALWTSTSVTIAKQTSVDRNVHIARWFNLDDGMFPSISRFNRSLMLLLAVPMNLVGDIGLDIIKRTHGVLTDNQYDRYHERWPSRSTGFSRRPSSTGRDPLDTPPHLLHHCRQVNGHRSWPRH